MTKATAKITDRFKRIFINTRTPEAFKAALGHIFKMGFRWEHIVPQRKIPEWSNNYLFVSSDGYVTHGISSQNSETKGYRQVFMDELANAAFSVTQIKRRENKASKKRRALRKWDATATKKTHEACPVDPKVIVAVRLRCGDTITKNADWFDWTTDGYGADIVSYKVIGYPKAAKEAPADDGWIEWDGSTHDNYDFMSGPVAENTLVDIRLRDGRVITGKRAGCIDGPGPYAAGAFWRDDGSDKDIVAYRLVKPVESKVVTQDEMVSDLAADMGKGLAVPVLGECQVLAPVGEPIPDTNPKRQYGVASVPLNMWSPLAAAYGALGLYNGSLKYGKANFANTPVEASIYIAAAMRHLSAWASGQEDDPADGVPNLGGVLANVAILLEARAAGMLIDDRLKMQGYLKEIEMLKAKVKALNELHAGKTPKHYTLEGE